MRNIIKRNLRLLTATQALHTIAMQITYVSAPIVTYALSDSAFLAGVAAAIAWVGRALMVYQSGRLMDRLGRRPVLLLGTLLMCLGLAVMSCAALTSLLPLFMAGLIIMGLGIGASQQNRVAAADMYPASMRGRAVGTLLAGSVIGSLAAPMLMWAAETTSVFYKLNHYSAAFILAVLALAPSAFTISRVRPDPKEIAINLQTYYPSLREGSDSEETQSKQFADSPSLLYFPILVAVIAIALAQGVMTMIMGLVPLYLNQSGMAATLITMVVTIHVIGMFGFSWPLGLLADKIGRKQVLIMGGIMAAAGCVMTPFSSIFTLLAAGIFLIGLGWSAALTASTTIISDVVTPSRRGRMIGISDTALGVAAITFPIAGGVILSLASFLILGMAGLIAMIPAIVLSSRLHEIKPGHYNNNN